MEANIILGLIAVLLCALIRSILSARHTPDLVWPELIASLEPLDTQAVRDAATCPNPDSSCGDSVSAILFPEDRIRLVANARTVLRLAEYAERWSPQMSRSVSRKLRRHLVVIVVNAYWARLPIFIPRAFEARGCHFLVAQAYVSMLDEVECLYKIVHVGRYPALRAALYAGSTP